MDFQKVHVTYPKFQIEHFPGFWVNNFQIWIYRGVVIFLEKLLFADCIFVRRNSHFGATVDSGYPDEILKSRNFSGWQKKCTKSENDR